MRHYYEGQDLYITYNNPMKSDFRKHDQVRVIKIDCAGNLTVRGMRRYGDVRMTLYPSQVTAELPPNTRRPPARTVRARDEMPDHVSDEEIQDYKLARLGIS